VEKLKDAAIKYSTGKSFRLQNGSLSGKAKRCPALNSIFGLNVIPLIPLSNIDQCVVK
jgi:hypothetical protein